MVSFTIPGRLPGLNEYIAAERSDRYKANKLKQKTEQRICLAVKPQLRGVRFTGPVVMRYTWFERDRRRDKDNIAFARKFVQDALVKCKVLKDDGWDEVAGFTDAFAVDKKAPRVEVEICGFAQEERRS